MSTVERNKGTLQYLFPFEEEYCQRFHYDNDLEMIGGNYRESLLEHTWEHQMVLDGKVYAIQYEIEGDTDCCSFAEVKKVDNETYTFHTLHYNACGLQEVIQDAIDQH